MSRPPRTCPDPHANKLLRKIWLAAITALNGVSAAPISVGDDLVTGRCFNRCKGGIQERLRQPAAIFALDVLDHAVFSNRFHLILRTPSRSCVNWPGWTSDSQNATFHNRYAKLLICTIDLLSLQDKPEARQLLHSLLQYVDIAAFAPKAALDVDLLKRLFPDA